MKLGLLLSKAIVEQFGETIKAGSRSHGVEAEFIGLPEDPKARLSKSDLARVNATFLTRDLRFSDYFPAWVDAITTAPDMRWVHFVTSGMNPYPWLEPMLVRGVRISTSTGSNAEPVAQIAMMGLLLMGRRAYGWIQGQHNHKWLPYRGKDVPPDLSGQTVVIVGLGAVGTHLGRFAQALRLKVVGVRRSPRRPEDPVDELVTPAQLKDVLPRADFLVLTCPLTAATRRMIDARTLSLLKPGASLINVSRGEVVDEKALVQALTERKLAGAYLDVYEKEPLPLESPLWDLPNVIMSPHNASSAQGNDGRGTQYFIENIGRLARSEPLVNEYKLGDEAG